MSGSSLLRLVCFAIALSLELIRGVRIDSDSQTELDEMIDTSADTIDSADDVQLKVLVVTVPGRVMSEERMKRLRPRLKKLGFESAEIEGPNMEAYCPNNISDMAESKAAGKHLLLHEWHGRMPDLKTYDLQLFQMATLVGHLRAWQSIADTKTPAIILEDDAEISSSQALHRALAVDPTANAVLLDSRHCYQPEPHHFSEQASGMAGYWLDGKAAEALLEHFPLSIPIDWGVNDVFNKRVRAVCPGTYPIHEHGGETFARVNSAAHGCHIGPEVAKGPHPVALLLNAQVVIHSDQ